MNTLQLFNFEEHEVRTLLINNEPWFVGSDVAKTLDYTNPNKAIRDHVDNEDKLTERIVLSGQNRDAIIINESGVYALVFGSKLPSAKKFKHWVTSEVLPTLRKTGGYKMPETFSEALRAYADEVEKNNQLSLENKMKDQRINELKPKADYTDMILSSKSLVTTTQIAKDYGMSGKAFNQLLHKYGIQYIQSGQWLLYSKYQSEGYTSSETIRIQHRDGTYGAKMNTKWTQKGRLFLYNKLKQKGTLPMIERI